jgi:hypothetical protein
VKPAAQIAVQLVPNTLLLEQLNVALGGLAGLEGHTTAKAGGSGSNIRSTAEQRKSQGVACGSGSLRSKFAVTLFSIRMTSVVLTAEACACLFK